MESGLFFRPVFDMTMFNDMFYEVNEKCNDNINSNLISID